MQAVDMMKLVEQVKIWREHLHQYPELSHKEFRTTEYILTQLSRLEHIEISQPAPTGIIARLKGAHPGKTIAFRADIDALPIDEKLDIPFRSSIPGHMHACGHDMHTAMLMGTAEALSNLQSKLHGEVVFIFQRGEEMSPGGAKELVDSGVLKDIKMFFALHVQPNLSCGHFSLKKGIATANRDTFNIYIHGKGGHSSMPHLSIDPAIAAAETVLSLQTIVAREINPQEAAVISVCSLISGDGTTAAIPNDAHICGTNRTFTSQVRQHIKYAMKRIVTHVALSHRCTGEIHFDEWDYSAIINDEQLCEIAQQVIQQQIGQDYFHAESLPMSVGEDFSEYQAIAPVCFVWLGVGKPGQDNPPLHNSSFSPDEAALTQGIKYYLGLAKTLLI